jgi:hypothetical protein
MLAFLTHEVFTRHLNTTFAIPTEDATQVDLTLVEVSEFKVLPRQEQFAIVFRGPLDKFLGQGMRPLRHHVMGDFELFLVPIKQDEEGFYYEAVFNRIRKQP